jgi:hypothetical protein
MPLSGRIAQMLWAQSVECQEEVATRLSDVRKRPANCELEIADAMTKPSPRDAYCRLEANCGRSPRYNAEFRPVRVSHAQWALRCDLEKFCGGAAATPDLFAKVNGYVCARRGWRPYDMDLKNRFEAASRVIGRRKGTI